MDGDIIVQFFTSFGLFGGTFIDEVGGDNMGISVTSIVGFKWTCGAQCGDGILGEVE